MSACYSLSTLRSSHFQFFILPRDRRSPRYLHLPSLHSGRCSNVISSERRSIHTSIPVPALSSLCFPFLRRHHFLNDSVYRFVCFLPFSSEYKLSKGRDFGAAPFSYCVLDKHLLGRKVIQNKTYCLKDSCTKQWWDQRDGRRPPFLVCVGGTTDGAPWVFWGGTWPGRGGRREFFQKENISKPGYKEWVRVQRKESWR